MNIKFKSASFALRFALATGSVLALGACDDDGSTFRVEGGGEPNYAIMYEVYEDSGASSSYLSLLSTLDVPAINPKHSIEFAGGRAFLQQFNGDLYIGLPSTPVVIRYSVDEKGKLEEVGRISFADFGFDGGQFDDWNVTFLSEHKAYLINFADATTIIWDPTDLEIVGEIAPPEGLDREGWSLEGSPAAVRADGLLFRTFDFADYATADYSTELYLAVYDTNTDSLVKMTTETRCPATGNLVHTDEAGNIYFSNWVWPIADALMRDGADPCVLRVNVGEDEFDADWTLDYGSFAGGRQGGMFSYLGNQQALVSIFYDENTSFTPETDPWSYVGSLNWKIWNVDMTTNVGAPLEGIDYNGGAYTPLRTANGLVLLVPGGDAEGYRTKAYEVVGSTVTPRVDIPGWSYQIEAITR